METSAAPERLGASKSLQSHAPQIQASLHICEALRGSQGPSLLCLRQEGQPYLRLATRISPPPPSCLAPVLLTWFLRASEKFQRPPGA